MRELNPYRDLEHAARYPERTQEHDHAAALPYLIRTDRPNTRRNRTV